MRHLVGVKKVRFQVGKNGKLLVTGGTPVPPHLEVNYLNVRSQTFLELLAIRTLTRTLGEGAGVTCFHF
jgi:hypothetical protein